MTSLSSLHFLILLHLSINQLTLAQDENQFIYHGFNNTNLRCDGFSIIHPNGLLQLTNTSKQQLGHAFYPIPMKFNTSSSRLARTISFSSNFVFAIVPEFNNSDGGHGMAFVISPSMDFTHALHTQYLGLFNKSNNGLPSNHVFAIELDTIESIDLDDINANHVGIDVNSLISNFSTPVTYFSNAEGENESLLLISGDPIQIWIDYDGFSKLINVTLAPININKPNQPLLSITIDLSPVLFDSMYVGFSSATGAVASNHYVLGWSFNTSGEAQGLDLSKLPSLPDLLKLPSPPDPSKLPSPPDPSKLPSPPPSGRKQSGKGVQNSAAAITIPVVLVVITIISGTAYLFIRKKYGEIYEEWEQEYGPQRLSYKDLYKATKGFKDKELIGVGGFGKVYRGVLPCSNVQVAVKRVSHDSVQGIKEFVSEIVSMGRLRHRNLMQLLGYCRRKGELLLVYDYMPNGSLDNLLHSNAKTNLNWVQRFRILKEIASGLLYMHEECEQVVLHRDVKSGNVLLDANLNGRLSDFGLARLHDHGEIPQTTCVVGTLGYIAPELVRTGKATTKTDVFAFGAFMLEMACGRRPIQVQGLPKEMVLVDWVFESWEQGDILQTSDTRLDGEYVIEEMELVLKLGLLCSYSDPAERPDMRLVMQYLDGSSSLPEFPLDSSGESAAMAAGASHKTVVPIPPSIGRFSVCSTSSSETSILEGR